MVTLPRLSETDIPDDSTPLSVTQDEPGDEVGQGGLFSRLFGDLKSETVADDTNADTTTAVTTQIAAADKEFPPETYGAASELPETREKQTGFFAALFSSGGKEDATTTRIAPRDSLNTTLPYGTIASVCDLAERGMGTKTAQFPEQRPRYKLYDTDPGNTMPHTFYLTGFSDGCARQFTASLAVFGSVGMHEQLRYGLPAEVQPYSDTDRAYEKVKSRICGVPRKKPCGSKLGRLETDTVFLSIYEKFGGNQRWSNLLLHGGQLVAQDMKG